LRHKRRHPVPASPTAQAPVTAEADDSAEIAQKLTNPLAAMISVPIQNWFDFNLGKSTVLFDSFLPLIEQDVSGAGARQEDRAGAASSVVWTTQGFPANNDDPSDAGLRKVHTAESDGTVMRIVQYARG
jgi:hypothetical protein